MAENKIYKKLPAVLQTTVIKNFFENTVEQLFSKSNVDNIQGFIGAKTSENVNVDGVFLREPTVTKSFYGLSPTINTINPATGESENFFFYDELINVLETYGVDTRDHNKIFSENYSVYLPPIDPDKLINYAEYYWYPAGPGVITVDGTFENPIDVDRDVIGAESFTPDGGKEFRNGMIVKFSGDYVIPQNKKDIEYIVEGVGDAIVLIEKENNYGTLYSREVDENGNPTQTTADYVVQQRGAANENTWSRVNFWFHKNNFLDAGDDVPSREYRARRPIIEFDRYLELYNHGERSLGTVDLVSSEYTINELNGADANVLVDGESIVNKTILFTSENAENAKYVYAATDDDGNISIDRVGDPILNPDGVFDGDPAFIPLAAMENDVIQVKFGTQYSGFEYLWSGREWVEPQLKKNVNLAPLFNLYDVNGVYIGDPGVYPNNNFAGNKIFGYAVDVPENSTDITKSMIADDELGFPLVYRQFKSSSEIVFENYQATADYNYVPFGGTESTDLVKNFYFKLDKLTPEYHGIWRIVDEPTVQRIYTLHDITQFDVDAEKKTFFVGCFPDVDDANSSGFNIRVRVNGETRTDFTYGTTFTAFIDFAEANFQAGDIVEIDAYSSTGLISENSISKFELPCGWYKNYLNEDIEYTSEPEYLTHFSQYMKNQIGFSGDVLNSNNFSSTAKDPRYANEIIQTNQDILLGAFLIDDQPHNLVDALRFCSQEYTKYRNRVRAEIEKFYDSNYTQGTTLEQALETVLRKVVSFKINKNTFNRTYIIPFGDIYTEERFTVALNQDTFVLDTYVDLDKIENSILVYKNGEELLCVDDCYIITNYNPITIQIRSNVDLQVGDEIIVKIYDENRDSAQCPPTPSTMGLYPLFRPEIVIDNSYRTPLEVIIGHDGSKTPAVGDFRDELLLEFEKRIFDSAKREFRSANSLPEYNVTAIKPGAFRNTGHNLTEFENLLRHNFAKWVTVNRVDPVVNEFFDIDDEWTWNYNPGPLPGHWKGLYLYYYDTIRPNTHPWEMLGFTEKPTWWDEEYYLYESDVIGRQIPYVDYTPANEKLWQDLEQGIIRQGPRENITNDRYLIDNPYRRIGLGNVIPVDLDGNIKKPTELFNTESVTLETIWNNVSTGNVDPDYDFRVTSYLTVNGLNISYDTGNVYVENLSNQSYTIPRRDLANVSASPSKMSVSGAIGVLVNGEPLYGQRNGTTWNDAGSWHYDAVREGLSDQVRVIDASVIGETEWDTNNHSPIVGWAFDGLPIYGPYGYAEYDANGNVANANITNVKSSYVVRTGTRADGPGGAYTGVFVEDYEHDANLAAQAGYADQYNMRYGVTPDSNGEPIHFYVTTVDNTGDAMFPYHVGGSNTGTVWNGYYYQESLAINQVSDIVVIDQGGLYTQANTSIVITGDGTGATAEPVIVDGEIASVTITNPGRDYTYAEAEVIGDGVRGKLLVQLGEFDNNNNNGFVNPNATPAKTSTSDLVNRVVKSPSAQWKFGDFAPVEQAWRYSEGYPFAVAEALLLAKPGRFATVFGEPTKLYRPAIDKRRLYNIDTGKRWQFNDPAQFEIHGEKTANDDFVTNVGYTQFVYSWLDFQGLDVNLDFADKLRTLNMKLAHRMSGYIDKDTLVARTDQYSTTGSATSLIIPQENIGVTVHSSPYKTRNYYSGVVVELTTNATFKVRGYDTTRAYFTVLESDTTGPRERVRVGGNPAPFVTWEPNTTYKKGTIVEYLGGYYEAPLTITAGSDFDKTLWTRLPSLPQQNAAEAVLYQKPTGREVRVDYETEFETVQEVYDFLISLGRYHTAIGYDFGDYDTEIADVRDWKYAAKQFLFWTTGKWETGNTILLSPLAPRAKFIAEQGFVAKINRNDREQFCIVDQDGAVIEPEECEIIREDDFIEIAPLDDTKEIYGLLLFVKEIEHVISFDNVTNFNDTIFDPVLNQKQQRIKLKGKRTSNWTGKLLTEGFVIDGEELLPNLDNMAESLGRYHEFGFIPVEKQLYEAARSLFGFTEKEYLREIDVTDDQQFEFYRGLIQNKGTTSSLSRIARSDSITEGNVVVYDEWALKLGDFGDTENFQSIELKLDRTDIVQDPQLVTLAFPEDVTNIIERVDVLDARYTYTTVPEIEIAPPLTGGEQATAEAILDSSGKIEKITVTNPGSNYPDNVGARVVIANVLLNDSDIILDKAVASRENDYILLSNANVVFSITDNVSNTSVTFDVNNSGNVILPEQIENAVNNTANVNVNVQAKMVATHNILGDANAVGYSLILSGTDFTVNDGANVKLVDGRYQPQQKFAVFTTEEQLVVNDAANVSEIIVSVNGNVISDYTYNSGQVIESNDLITDYQTTLLTELPANITYPRSERIEYPGNGEVVYNIANTNPVFTFSGTNLDANSVFGSDSIDENGRYRFVDVYVNGILVENTANTYNWYDTDGDSNTSGTTWSNVSGQVYTLTQNSIQFNDISLLPEQVLTVLYNPPLDANFEGTDREIFYALTSDTEIKIVERATVTFDGVYSDDVPGATVNIRVTSAEGIAARVSARRNYEITPDAKDDDVILIDIDDSERFLKKPSGVRENNLWPTLSDVDHTGVTNQRYPTVRNAGYVDAGNVNYQAFDIASLPDLFDDNIVIKPREGDLIHVARAERDDWNVYKLTTIDAAQSFLYRNSEGQVSLYTDFSLFNYLDTNQIGEPGTGRYLDYYLTLENSQVSDNVVVWRNENIVNAQQLELAPVEAPRMIQARIASIGPADTVAISSIEPSPGKTLPNLTLTPSTQYRSDVVIVSGDVFGVAEGDAIQLTDDVGTSYTYIAAVTSPSANTFALNVGDVEGIEITNPGYGYTEKPNVIIEASPLGSEFTARAEAFIDGCIDSFTVTSSTDWTEAQLEINGSLYTYPTDPEDTTTPKFNVYISGGIDDIAVTNGGNGYDPNNPPTVTITGGTGTGAAAEITSSDIVDGSIVSVQVTNSGSGYTQDNLPTVEIGPPTSGPFWQRRQAYAEVANIFGNVSVDVEFCPGGIVELPEFTIIGDGSFATVEAVFNASVRYAVVTYPGAGYTGTPNVTIDASTGVTATANAIFNTGIDELQELYNEYGSGNVMILFNAEVDADLQANVLANIDALTQDEINTVNTINEITNRSYFVDDLDAANSIITISNPLFDSDIASNLDSASYTIVKYEDYSRANADYYIASNVTNTSFEITRPNTVRSTRVTGNHLNRSRIIAEDHMVLPGDVVRINTNTFGGEFVAEGVTANSFVINSPFTFGFEEGSIIREGVKIKTIGAHGITPAYARFGKRIAVHFANPLYYNKTYSITDITPDTITITGRWPRDNRTYVYYEEKTGVLNASNVYDEGNVTLANATNVIRITPDYRLSDTLAFYNSNTAIVNPGALTYTGNAVIVDPAALPSNANISTTITVMRQVNRRDNRYPILTTLDHSRVKMNGSEINIDSYNNIDGLTQSLNRNMQLRRFFTKQEPEFSGLRFAMMNNYRTPVTTDANGKPVPAFSIGNYGPYIRDEEVINALSGNELPAVGNVVISDAREKEFDASFNQGPRFVGPTFGLVYTDPNTQTEFRWDPTVQAYKPVKSVNLQRTLQYEEAEVAPPPESHIDSSEVPDPEAPLLVLTRIPGTGTNGDYAPGRRQSSYNMVLTREFTVNGDTFSVPAYRLKPSRDMVFEVYQAVQNNADDVYYILIDISNPPQERHDFYATVNQYSDFLNYPTTDFYFRNEVAIETDIDGKITNANDPVRLTNRGTVVELPPAEPAVYLGKQTVPEPFALVQGNNSDAIQNFESLPELVIGSDESGGRTKIEVSEPGYDSFLLWTPGLEPGKWAPTSIGPGKLPGTNDNLTIVGFGRGYYTANDNHLGADIYPVRKAYGYDEAIPRFMYARKFSVYPAQNNKDDNIEYVPVTDLDIQNEGIRPEEIFVACFWSEPFTYQNQLVRFDYNQIDANGVPAPIYDDYQGTVTRVKYIRLTELPPNAVTRRIIPDTGWGGKGWNNARVDEVELNVNDESIWDIFDPTLVSSGSTGNDDEGPVITIGSPLPGTPAITSEGEFINDRNWQDIVPVTAVGPVLDGSVLEGLPGPCEPVPDPNTDGKALSCSQVKFTDATYKLTPPSTSKMPDNETAYYQSIRVVGDNPVRVFFKSIKPDNGIGIVIVQNTQPYTPDAADFDESSWWENARYPISTISSGTSESTNGSQIGNYGRDTLVGDRKTLPEVNIALGYPGDAEIIGNEEELVVAGDITVDGSNWLRQTGPNDELDDEYAVKGVGFLQRNINCILGEYITVFIKDGETSEANRDWTVYITYTTEAVGGDLSNQCTAIEIDSPSAAYLDGAIMKQWLGISNETTDGYFGQDSEAGESGNFFDNIYFPYQRLPASGYRILNSAGTAVTTASPALVESRWVQDNNNPKTAKSNQVILDSSRTIRTLNSYTFPRKMATVEIKGYFRAPATGPYEFFGSADDGLWVWVSSSYDRTENGVTYRTGKDDLSQDEYFLDDGYPAGGLPNTINSYLNSKRYHRDNAVFKTGKHTTGSRATVEYGNTIVNLEEGKYYFVRIVAGSSAQESGNNNEGGSFSLSYRIPSSGVDTQTTIQFSGINGFVVPNVGGYQIGRLEFSGRFCPEIDSPPEGSDDEPGDSGGGDTGGGGGGGTDTRELRFRQCAASATGNPVDYFWSTSQPWPVSVQQCWYNAYGTCPPQTPNCTSNFSASRTEDQNDSDFLNPAPAGDSVNDPDVVINQQTGTGSTSNDVGVNYDTAPSTPYVSRGGGTGAGTNGAKTFLNYSGYSQPMMSGYNYFPTTYKIDTRELAAVQNYGFGSRIPADKFVSATQQRVTGGRTVPLAEPSKVVSREATDLRNVNVVQQPWSRNLPGTTTLNNTVRYNPTRIGASYNANGTLINNAANRSSGILNNTLNINGPAFGEPGTGAPQENSAVDTGTTTPTENNAQFRSFDNRNIRYNKSPYIDITPITFDQNGSVPAGPTARARITRPTPSVTLRQEDLLGIQENSELVLNGRRILVRGRSFQDIKTQVNCANIGIRAVLRNTSAGERLTLSSCDGRAWRAANGCAGGRYTQVGDFHINRGFEQARNNSETITEQYVFGPVSGTFNSSGAGTIGQTRRTFSLPRYVAINGDGVAVRSTDPGISEEEINDVTIEFPSIAPVYSRTDQSTFTTGGSGYRIGDRLRLIGGTPVNNTKGPLTKICIDSAGSGYTNPANLQVVINSDGNAPGIGAAAQVTQLDENGGIAEIIVVNQGAGYDIDRPPKVEIVDRSPQFITPVVIKTAWPENITVSGGSIIEVQYEKQEIDANGNKTGTFIVDTRFVRATAPVTFGQEESTDVAIANVAFIDPANSTVSNAPRVEIQVDTQASFNNWIRPNSYVRIDYTPVGGTATSGLFWIPEPQDNDPTVFEDKFYIEDPAFTSEDAVANIFGGAAEITVTARRPWWKEYVNEGSRPTLVDTVNPRLDKATAQISAKIALNPDLDPNSTDPQDLTADDVFADGYSSFAGPQRVAKFIVTDVDENGSITSLRVIDRGLYKIFPSDLTFGIPLEYDYASYGSGFIDPREGRITESQRKRELGVGDPARDNILYGTSIHPEYRIPPFNQLTAEEVIRVAQEYAANNPPANPELEAILNAVLTKADTQGIESLTEAERAIYDQFVEALEQIIEDAGLEASYKHPDWKVYPEFYWNGQEFVPYTGSPGAYDPNTYAIIDTAILGLNKSIDEYDNVDAQNAAEIGRLLKKSYAIDTDSRSATYGQYKFPKQPPAGTGARLFITAQEVPDCSEKGTAKDSLGIPDVVNEINAPESLVGNLNDALTGAGYNPEDISFDVTPIGGLSVVDLNTRFPGVNIDGTPGIEKLGLPLGDYNVGMLCIQGTVNDPGIGPQQLSQELDRLYETEDLGLLDEQRIAEITGRPLASLPPTRILSLLCVETIQSDNNSIFGDSQVIPVRDLYRYDITNIFGAPVTLTSTAQKSPTKVCVFDSQRFNTNNPLADSANISLIDNAWIDNYQEQGWAYLENGIVKRQQEPLVDTDFVHNAIVYDGDTGERIRTLDFWDPFKGVLPGFIDNEIDFITDEDPVSYNDSRSMFGRSQVGKVWWDTSTVRYMWYEQGANIDRWKNWGRTFPGSTITVCEWVESRALPQNWSGNGVPRWRDRYVTERHKDPSTGEYTLYYYYWVQNRSTIDDRIKRDLNRQLDTETIARYIANPVGYGLNMISFASDESFVLSNISEILDAEQNHLQINLSRNLNPDGLDHTAWKLAREGDDSSIIPEHLSEKLIDSLCGQNAVNQEVPDPRLSVVEKYGIGFRPRQTMFRDVKEARRVMASFINETLADTKLNSQYPTWDSGLPGTLEYVETVNWYAVARTDNRTNTVVRYDASYKPIYKVSNIAELRELNGLPDETVVQVRSSESEEPQLWLYDAVNDDFILISIANDTIRFKDNIFKDDTNQIMCNEIRAVLIALKEKVFANTAEWNKFFFEMLKYAYTEQGQLSWAFKTSYLYVEKQEKDLEQFVGFNSDNFNRILEYMNEVKPYNAKIREYKDGKTAPVDIIGQGSISDYDKPPYIDAGAGITRILDETDPGDLEIMQNSPEYRDYAAAYVTGNTDVIRKTNTVLVFDRTNWEFTQTHWDKTTTEVEQSIAQNIANITQIDGRAISQLPKTRIVESNVAQGSTIIPVNDTKGIYVGHSVDYETLNANIVTGKVSGIDIGNTSIILEEGAANTIVSNTVLRFHTDDIRAIDRIFKFDPVVQNTFAVEVNRYFDDATAADNPEIVGNAQAMAQIVYDNGLEQTLALLKTKVGGDFRGTQLDGGIFDQFIQEQDFVNNPSSEFGYDIDGFDETALGTTQKIDSYEGVLNTETQGESTLEVDGELYDGFAGTGFQRVLYGSERPEELALLSPLETLIITVKTSPVAYGANVEVDPNEYDATLNDENLPLIIGGREVTYRMHQTLFGETDYLRINDSARTTITSNIFSYTEVIEVEDASFLPTASREEAGVIWINDEKIEYRRIDENKISGISRGVDGTTIQDHLAGSSVYSGAPRELFNNLNPESNIWLDVGKVYANEDRWIFNDLWDEVDSGNINIFTANVLTISGINVSTLTATLEIDANIGFVEDTVVIVSDASNAQVNVYSIVSNVTNSGNTITITAPYTNNNIDPDTFGLFFGNASLEVSRIEYVGQNTDYAWDSAINISDTAISLSDIANADFTRTFSIMRFLHDL